MNEFIEKPINKRSRSNKYIVHGIGINDAEYIVHYRDKDGNIVQCPFYSVWCGFMRRCYSNAFKARCPTYQECSAVDDWHLFSNFKKWMETQDWKGKDLDKDILFIGNKIYSPKTCLFIDEEINTLINYHDNRKRNHPLGVSLHKPTGLFRSRCNVNGKCASLGYFKTSEDASNAYKVFKAGHIKKVADKQDPIIKEALIKHADLLLTGV